MESESIYKRFMSFKREFKFRNNCLSELYQSLDKLNIDELSINELRDELKSCKHCINDLIEISNIAMIELDSLSSDNEPYTSNMKKNIFI